MSIQILGLRPYFDQKAGKEKKKHAFFEQHWRVESVEYLFANLDFILQDIPEHERWNLYFTVHDCLGEKERDFSHGHLIPIDLDNVDLDRIDETVDCVLNTLGLEKNKTGILCSGNGLQFFIHSGETFKTPFFKQKKIFYKHILLKINKALSEAGLKGEADPAVWEPRRLMRLPGTINRKKDREDRKAYLIQSVIEPQGFSFEDTLGLERIAQGDALSEDFVAKHYPHPDTPTILRECNFLKYCKENQTKISEPEWYAMLSIVGRLENGLELVHTFSKEHPGYSPEETEEKLEQALINSGPRTCKNINDLWDNCKSCKHWGKITCPITIQGKGFIRTKSTGFYDVFHEAGKAIKRKPNYNDLLKYFNQKHPYIVQADTESVYSFNNMYWTEQTKRQIKAFAEEYFEPKPIASMRSEFYDKVLSNNVRERTWCEGSADKKLCLQNGVLDIASGELEPHSKKYFFTGALPYNYDPHAECPNFDKFMEQITMGDKQLQENLLEFVGYAISGDQYWLQKCLVLVGSGANGKSTFIEVIKELVGEGLYTSLSLSGMEDPQKRYLLVDKLLNLGEENNVGALFKSEAFKTAAVGGELEVKKVYQVPFMYRNKAKLIFACNEMPKTYDESDGFFRRLLIIPFKAKFNQANKNVDVYILDKLKKELPGILNKVIGNYKNLKKRGILAESEASKKALEEYKQENSGFLQWFQDHLKVTGRKDDFVTTKELYNEFRNFCEESGIDKRYSSLMIFSKKMALYENEFWKAKKEGKRGYKGIKLIGQDF